MTHEEAINDLNVIKEFFEKESGAYPVSLEYAINALKSGTKVVAQITFDEEKLCEIVKEAVERFKEEYEIVDRPQGEWINHFDDIWPEESTIQCSLCREHQPLGIDENFCPNCGAKMFAKDTNVLNKKGVDDE